MGGTHIERTAAEIAAAVGGTLHGDGSRVLRSVRTLEDAGEDAVSFLANPRYGPQARESRAGVVLCAVGADLAGRDRIEVENPYYALAQVLGIFHPPAPEPPGLDPRAAVAEDCVLGRDVRIGPFAVVGRRCRLGDGVVIGAGAVLEDDVEVGAGSVIHPHAVVYRRCRIGSRVTLHAGVVIGCDGFGYAFHDGEHHKVPQMGDVVIEDDVEIGAGTTIDRATLGSTVIGRGSKIDDQVMVAHNVVLGEGSILVAQSGVAGSSRLGRFFVLAGQSGVAGHLTAGDGARVAAKSAMLQDLPAGTTAAGIPALPIARWRRIQAALARLPEILRRLRRLERAAGTPAPDENEEEEAP